MVKACLLVVMASATAAAAPRVRVTASGDPIYVQRELRDIAGAVGAFLARAGFDVVPSAEIERLTAIAHDGRNLRTGDPCGVPVPARQLLEQQLPGVKIAWTRVTCETTCTLVVAIGDSDRWEVALPAHPTPAQVVAAAKRLKRHPPPTEEYGGLVGVTTGRTGVALDLTKQGAWASDPERAIETQRAALDACLTDIHRGGYSNAIVLDIAPGGTAAACEPENADELPAPGFACLCDALGKVDFAKAADTGISSLSIAACVPMTGAISPAWKTIPFEWHVDATGRVTRARAAISEATPDMQHCVETALRAATFACPQQGGNLDVTTTLSITPR